MVYTILHLKTCWQQKRYRNCICRLSATNTPPQGLLLLDQQFTEEKGGGGV